MNTSSNDSLRELLRISTPALAGAPDAESLADLASTLGPLGQQWQTLLHERNGFTAFESALVVRPFESTPDLVGTREWNDPEFWGTHFGSLAPKGICFAEDVFGNPFVLRADGIHAFDLETGETEPFAASLMEWAQRIRDERSPTTGWPLAHEWLETRSTIPLGCRLAPKRPFVLGGDYTLDNLALVRDVEGIRARGSLARTLQHLPSGSPVAYELRVEG